MTNKKPPKNEAQLPYGSAPPRPRTAFVALGIIYGVWLAFLLWMAIDRASSS